MGIDANVSLKPSNEPELPRVYVDTALYAPTGDTHHVAAGGNLQTAINAAALGDVITLEAGATFTGPFTLPDKGAGTNYVIIRTDTTDGNFVAEGTRVAPADASLMAKLVASSGVVLSCDASAHHYRLIGLEVAPSAAAVLNGLIESDVEPETEATLPHHLIVDRCYVHGLSTVNLHRAILLNSGAAAVIDSYISEVHEVGNGDTQAIAAWNGAGPFKIENNYLEAAGENVLFGGATPTTTGIIQSDISITRNHFYKPLTWKTDDPSYAGIHWAVKNLFEIKSAQRVLVEGNLFEHNWADAQDGYGIILNISSQAGEAPWNQCRDITFRNNVVRSSGCGFSVSGLAPTSPAEYATRIAVRNNLLLDIDGTAWGGAAGHLFITTNGVKYLSIEHNTAWQSGQTLVTEGEAAPGFVYRYNIAPHNTYGLKGTGKDSGLETLNYYFPGFVFISNVLTDKPTYYVYYPEGNYFPDLYADCDFEDLGNGDYRLSVTSPYKGQGDNGSDIGIDKTALDAAMGDLAQSYW